MQSATRHPYALDAHKEAGHPVLVAVPALVAYDISKMQEVTRKILGRLGCEGCHSGHDIRFVIENRFIVDEKLNINVESPLHY